MVSPLCTPICPSFVEIPQIVSCFGTNYFSERLVFQLTNALEQFSLTTSDRKTIFVMSSVARGRRSSGKLKTMGREDEFLSRITKSLYYSKLPKTDRLSLPVTEFAAELFSEVKNGCTLERLDAEEASRISRNACVSPCSFVLALLYLERLKDCNPEYLYTVAPSELFLVSLMIASKFLNDNGEEDEVFNSEWAQSGELTTPQINKLEKDFLNAINWEIFIHNDQFWDRLRKLEKDLAYKEGMKRGWFSYQELSCLIENIRITAIVQALISISSVCLAAYTAGVVTLLGSALIASHIPGTCLAPRTSSPSLNATKILGTAAPTLPKVHDNFNELDRFSEDVMNQEGLRHNFIILGHYYEHSEAQNETWHGWLASLANWMPEYSEKNKNQLKKMAIPLHNPVGSFVTNSQALMGDHKSWNDFVTEINWKETLKESLEGPSSWQYYVELVSKISIGG
ncbi:protein CNPPD1 [Diachasmimorpha longicaudata]|uniref:protein CNPPD1 n=1 Tax=Diachasmimorpha longicaudata TaxID=58733 RepID=UPI0030B8A70E